MSDNRYHAIGHEIWYQGILKVKCLDENEEDAWEMAQNLCKKLNTDLETMEYWDKVAQSKKGGK